MFKYALVVNKTEILNLKKEIDLKRNDQTENNREIDRINDCLGGFQNINEAKFTVGLSVLMALLGLVGLISSVSILLTSFFFVGGSGLAIKNVKVVNKIKDYLKNNYADLLEYDIVTLLKRITDLNTINNSIDGEIKKLYTRISYHENELSIINRLYDDVKLLKDPYYIADSKEQYEVLTKLYEGNFNEFLVENINYSSVHFDSSIDNKKLIKIR